MLKYDVRDITKLAQRVENALITEDFDTARSLLDTLIYSLQRVDKYLGSYLRLVNKTDALKKRAEDGGFNLIDVIMDEEA